MIDLSDTAASVLRDGGFDYHVRAFVTLDGNVLAEDVPIVAGTEEYDSSLTVPERVTVTVPRLANGVDWSPNDQGDPLSAFGQRLHVSLGIGLGGGQVEWFDRGEFLIFESNVDGDRVEVTAVGLLSLIDEARLVSPFQPTGTLVSTLRALIEPALTVMVDSSLTDRSVPAGINYDDDRLGAVTELLDAWPAVAFVTPDGYLVVQDAGVDPDHWTLLAQRRPDQPRIKPTIIRQQGGSTRDSVYNAVVARGTAADGGQVQGVAYDTSHSASAYGGPFNPLPVPYFYASPLLTTTGQCQAAATSVLNRLIRSTYGRFDVETPPIPILTGADGIAIASPVVGVDTDTLCRIESFRLPYTADGGSMTMSLRREG